MVSDMNFAKNMVPDVNFCKVNANQNNFKIKMNFFGISFVYYIRSPILQENPFIFLE